MRADDYFDAVERLPVGTLADITRGGGLVVVAPHPDDESLGCGGLIAEACVQGTPVRLVVLSDGGGSHPNSPSYPAPRLRALRECEAREAAATLGLAEDAIRFLGLPDRHVPTQGAAADMARSAIGGAARACDAGAVCVTWRHDPHCDHQAAAALVEQAELGDARRLAYPIWGFTLPPGTEVGPPPRGLRLPIAGHRATKAAAIAAHRSQTTDLIGDDPRGFRLAPEIIERFLAPFETFLEFAA